MKTVVDLRLQQEAAHFRLRHGCEDCAHFVEETARCAHGYPNATHFRIALAPGSEFEFCKEFELS
jgi:hypothetical protein